MSAASQTRTLDTHTLTRWRRRLTPRTAHDAWRGQLPRLQQQALTPSLLTRSGYLYAETYHRLRLAYVRTATQGVLVWPLGAASGALSLGTGRVVKLVNYLLRGLGGLCRLKLRFKGKSFKWHRRRGALLLRFGHAHLVALRPLPGVRWRRFGRMKILLYGADWWGLLEYARAVCWWRPVNVYHGRGLRLRRQSILRKAGKVSAYR